MFHNFTPFKSDIFQFIFHQSGVIIYIFVYVDDATIASSAAKSDTGGLIQ
uniref:Reverse transcriptase Ty1/copia-type domain-containing protein n=1 Tax=Oryza meridionalis TaxID=40149 RepID=A0A0E0E9I5_9ORYZ